MPAAATKTLTQKTSEAIARAALRELNSPKVDAIRHGEVTFVIRDSEVQRIDIRESILTQEPK